MIICFITVASCLVSCNESSRDNIHSTQTSVVASADETVSEIISADNIPDRFEKTDYSVENFRIICSNIYNEPMVGRQIPEAA